MELSLLTWRLRKKFKEFKLWCRICREYAHSRSEGNHLELYRLKILALSKLIHTVKTDKLKQLIRIVAKCIWENPLVIVVLTILNWFGITVFFGLNRLIISMCNQMVYS